MYYRKWRINGEFQQNLLKSMIRNQRKILELKGIITEINKLINEFN